MIFDTLSNLETYRAVVPQLQVVADAMDHDGIYDLQKGHYKTPDPKVSYDVVEYNTSSVDKPFTFHKNRTVVEIILSGRELISSSWRELTSQADVYDKTGDTGFFSGEPISVVQGAQGRFALFLPGEPYKSSVSDAETCPVKKVIFTIVEN